MKTRGRWYLRHYLAALLTLATVLTVVVVGSSLLFERLPELERQNSALALHEARHFAQSERTLLRATENRLRLLAHAVQLLPAEQATAMLDAALLQDDTLRSVFVTSAAGRVTLAGLRPEDHALRSDSIGSDLSRTPLLTSYLGRGETTWSAKYLSLLSGQVTVGVAVGVKDGRVLVAEVPLDKLIRPLASLGSQTRPEVGQHVQVLVVDGNGEVLADSEAGRAVGKFNLARHPLIMASQRDGVVMRLDNEQGLPNHMAAVHADELDWHFVTRVPAGIRSDSVRSTVIMVASGFVGSLLIGLALAPLWARGLSREIDAIVARTRAGPTSTELARPPWPRGQVREFNYLAGMLDEMEGSMQEREQKLQAIFNLAPVPMVVTDVAQDLRLLEVNDAWCSQFGHAREVVTGRAGEPLLLWRDPAVRMQAIRQALQGEVSCEAGLRHANGRVLLCRVSARMVALGQRQMLVWSMEDLTEMRRNEVDLRVLNADLEARVAQRTAALSRSNAELREALDHLKHTRNDLVRSEKMAALGSLVAGVAHELNTPLGNSLMAITTLRDEAAVFNKSQKDGLRRAALDRMVAQLDQATRITERNLSRAVDLVTSFKQVAVDQTSAQRRRFQLDEVVCEILLTLKPGLSRTPFQVLSDLPSGIEMDSYPGPLGQVLTNLISNAVQHGLEGREQGSVRIEANPQAGDRVVLRVIDDGQGIVPELLPRIFDPFVTTRMGRGGTGLGLNIAYNLAHNLLGGHLGVESVVGQGACFTLELPLVAPVAAQAA